MSAVNIDGDPFNAIAVAVTYVQDGETYMILSAPFPYDFGANLGLTVPFGFDPEAETLAGSLLTPEPAFICSLKIKPCYLPPAPDDEGDEP